MNAYAIERMEPLNCKVKMETSSGISAISLNMEERKNVYLIFKEAVNNAAKYAACKNLFISLSLNHHQFKMEISDDGNGFDTLANEGGRGEAGNGLANMRKRAKELNGTFTLLSNKNKGTSIQLTFGFRNH